MSLFLFAPQLPEPGPNLTTILVTLFTTMATILTAYFGTRQYQRMKARRESERPEGGSDPTELDITEHDRPSRLNPPPEDLQGFDPETHPDRPSRIRHDAGRQDSDPRTAPRPPRPAPSQRRDK